MSYCVWGIILWAMSTRDMGGGRRRKFAGAMIWVVVRVRPLVAATPRASERIPSIIVKTMERPCEATGEPRRGVFSMGRSHQIKAWCLE
jgi:hypothetical protein